MRHWGVAMATVLVADDEPEVCYLVSLYLRRDGHRVLSVGDGPAVLSALARWHPDLLVLDMSLPGMDGLELCRKIRADPATANTRILMLSGWTFDSDIQAGLDAGADDYVTKPFHGPDLVERAEALLAREHAPVSLSPRAHAEAELGTKPDPHEP
jgi:DNA-binding response OmpR family regulator